MVAPALHYPQQERWFMSSGPSDDPGILARIVYRLRMDAGMTQEQLADALGWEGGNTAISRLERGRTRLPGKDKIAQLERVFGTEPGYIEDQLPRREKQMLAPPPGTVVDLYSPERIVGIHAAELARLDPTGKAVDDVVLYIMSYKRRLRGQQHDEDQEDTESGAKVPGT